MSWLSHGMPSRRCVDFDIKSKSLLGIIDNIYLDYHDDVRDDWDLVVLHPGQY